MRCIYLLLFAMISSAVFAQQDTSRLITKQVSQTDSSTSRINTKIDSIQGKINSFVNPDLSLASLNNKIRNKKRKEKKDSIQFYKKLETEKKKVREEITRRNESGESTVSYEHQLDSLEKVTYQEDKRRLSNPSAKQKVYSIKGLLTHEQDSISGLSTTTHFKSKAESIAGTSANKVESKVDGAGQRINAPVNKVEGTINEKLSLMNQQGGAGANLPSNADLPNGTLNTNLTLPQENLKLNDQIGKVDNPLSNQPGTLSEATTKVTEVKSIPQEQIGKVKTIGEIQSAQGKLSEANVITDKAQAYGSDVQNVVKGNLSEVKEVPKALEAQALKLDEVQGIQKEAGALDQYKNTLSKANDPKALKQEAVNMAMDHLSGQEEKLKSAMQQMNKLKSKFSDINGLDQIPKRKPNEMKGKPLIERIVPGITLQIQKTRDVLIDYNPYVGYRFYGKLTAGAGWNERVGIGHRMHVSLKERIYGPRVFADFKLRGGFSVRTDIEKMNTFIPSVAATGHNGDPSHRAWVWSAFIGIKKEYKFAGSVKGNAQFLYNLYDDHYNSPYADRFAVRMGFEFPMKKKKPVSE